ncbi:MAG: ABC transporter permease [Anaerolineae bacterium]|nr:ABC transporter permease [Anaerolineae bacterium]
MSSRDLLHLVISNLGRMKARVAMTAIGVVIGTAAVIVLISLAAGLQRTAAQDLGSIGELTEITVFGGGIIREIGGSRSSKEETVLNDRALAEFRDLPGVVAVTPRESLMGGGMLRLNRLLGTPQIVGIDPTQVKHLGFALASGTDRLGRWQVLAGARVAEGFLDTQKQRPVREPPDLQGQALQLVLSKMRDDGHPVERVVRLRVTGVLEESGGQDDYTLYLALNDVLELNGWLAGRRSNPGRDGYNQVLVKVADPERALGVEREITGRGFIAWSARSMMQQINIFFLVIQGVFGGIGAIALIVAAFGIANTMTMATYERTREIGLMKAVGATNRDVMSVFLAEAGGIGLLGGLGGVMLGAGLGALIDLIAGTYLAAMAVQSGATASDVNISLIHTPLWLPIFAVVFATLVGVVSGVYPAVRAASLSPIAALKYE